LPAITSVGRFNWFSQCRLVQPMSAIILLTP
jgi:hypothetical protein